MSQSLAQKRAKDALDKIEALRVRGDCGKYTSYVSALPAEIIMSGLGQAMALVRSKYTDNKEKLKGYKDLYGHLESWLCSERANAPYGPGSLLKHILDGSEAEYIRAQAEAMAYLEWLKKFAVALLIDEDDMAVDEGAQDG